MSSTTAAPNLCHSASVQALLLSTMRLLYDAHMFADKLTVVWRSCVPCTCGLTRSRRESYRRVSLAQRWSVEEQRACAAGFSRPPPARSCGIAPACLFRLPARHIECGGWFLPSVHRISAEQRHSRAIVPWYRWPHRGMRSIQHEKEEYPWPGQPRTY